MLRSTPWLRLLLEGSVIVGSILLAFGIDAWWDARQEEVVLLQQKELLRAQMESNRSLLVQDIRRAHEATAALDALVRVMSPQPPALSPDSVRALLDPGLGMNDIDLETAAIESLLAPGYLDLRRDSTINREMVEFRGMAQTRSRDVGRFVDVRERVRDLLYSLAPMASLERPGADDAFPIDTRVLLSDFQLQGLLAELWYRHNLRLNRSEDLLETAEGILAELALPGS